MGVFDNEFFTCPTYTWGVMVIAVLGMIIVYIMMQIDPDWAVSTAGIVGLLVLGWALWSAFRFIKRDPNCHRVGFGEAGSNLPWSTTGPGASEGARPVMESAGGFYN